MQFPSVRFHTSKIESLESFSFIAKNQRGAVTWHPPSLERRITILVTKAIK